VMGKVGAEDGGGIEFESGEEGGHGEVNELVS
jgi:hypothetical protein